MTDKALTDLPDGGAATSGDVIYVVRSGNSRKAAFPTLADVATTGDYGDLDNTPTLGGAAALDVGTTAGTVAAGNDSRIVGAVQGSREITAGDGLTGGGDLSANRSFALDKASNAQVAAGTLNKALTADLIPSASAWSSVGSNTVAIDWNSALTFERVATGNITVSNPTNGQPGTVRYLRLLGNNSTQRSISFGNQFTGALPDRSVNNAQRCILVIVCETTTSFTVTEIPAGVVP